MLADMRFVMLGFRDAGKSSAGNTILGGQHFNRKKIVQCVKGEGDIDGRHVTIIKAPGWEKNQLLKDTPELMKEELTLSVSLCPPGPHSVLLVMRAGMKFTETSRRAAQEHVELLGDDVWTHTIVLFTHGDWLGESSIEQYIESEGKPLQWLVEKCGNRYHVFSDDKDNKVQVSELFNKVDETVAENSGYYFKIDENKLKAVAQRITTEKTRAKQMRNKLLEQSDTMATQDGDGELENSAQPWKYKPTTCVIKDLGIVLLGQLNAGKSSLGNRLIGRGNFHSENTLQSVKQQGRVAGRRITVINTPGWGPEQRLSETPELTRQEIILSVSSCDPGPHVLVLVIRVDGKFTELNRRAVQDHMDLLGPGVWEHTLLVFSCGDISELVVSSELGDSSIEQHLKRKGKPLHWLIKKCGNRFYVLDNNNRTDVKDLLDIVEKVAAENDGHHYEIDREVLQEVEEKRKVDVERANNRKTRVIKQWEVLKNMADSYKMEMGHALEKTKIGHRSRNGDHRSRIPVRSKSSGSYWWDTEEIERLQLETRSRDGRPSTAGRLSRGKKVRWQDETELPSEHPIAYGATSNTHPSTD